MGRDVVALVRRGLKKPLPVIVARLRQEMEHEAERWLAPRRARVLTRRRLLANLQNSDLESLWARLAARPYPGWFGCPATDSEAICADRDRIMSDAERALRHEVSLLGAEDVPLGAKINWYRDPKSGREWPPAFYRSISFAELGAPSDVKLPWEISRVQWLIPAGQAYRLTREDRFAAGVREVIEQWIDANPFAWTVNWTCTMEVALRILSWTWLFHACQDAPSWKDQDFRCRFLTTLYLHGDFTQRHLEISDINGNHYTADAAGLVFAGLFFGEGSDADRWAKLGWDILTGELNRQVTPDGVDFEASVPYHRLVLELFFLPAFYRLKNGLPVGLEYRERLLAMASFTQAYTREDGTAPLWGDADDARALPFGGQDINNHSYIPAMVGLALSKPEIASAPKRAAAEVLWLLGPAAAAEATCLPAPPKESRCFPDAGFFIMRGPDDHIFIDCGPIGLGGRGGHGHNDCLAFAAVLDGVELVTDCGAYLYTASVDWRNHFRTTAQHNTPQIAGEEINRLIRPDYLWNMHYDAIPELRLWQVGADADVFIGAHAGYRRLTPPVTPVRTVRLVKGTHALIIEDSFEGGGAHQVRVPYHLAPGVTVTDRVPDGWFLRAAGRRFRVIFSGDEWATSLGDTWVSPSYGVKHQAQAIIFSAPKLVPLRVAFLPEEFVPDDPQQWLRTLVLA